MYDWPLLWVMAFLVLCTDLGCVIESNPFGGEVESQSSKEMTFDKAVYCSGETKALDSLYTWV